MTGLHIELLPAVVVLTAATGLAVYWASQLWPHVSTIGEGIWATPTSEQAALDALDREVDVAAHKLAQAGIVALERYCTTGKVHGHEPAAETARRLQLDTDTFGLATRRDHLHADLVRRASSQR